MSIQVYFKKKDAFKAGATLISYPSHDEKPMTEYGEYYVPPEQVLYIPEIKDRCFFNLVGWYCKGFDDTICCNFNEWGTNKHLLKPWLDKNNIKYYEA